MQNDDEQSKSIAQKEPLIWASVIQHLKLPLSEHHIDVNQLFAECDIENEELEHPHSQIPLTRYLRFLNKATLQTNEPLLSIKLAKSVGVELLGALGFLCFVSPSVKDLLSALCDYQNLLQESTTMTLTRTDDYFRFGYEVYGTGDIDIRKDVEFSLAFTTQLVRLYSNNKIKPIRICFRHSPAVPIAHYERLLSVPCYFEQEHNEIHLSLPDIKYQSHRHDPSLYQILKDYLDSDLIDKNLNISFSDQVRKTIIDHLQGKPLNAPQVAQLLGISKATLNRRLHQEQTTFKSILDDVQYEIARKYLNGSRQNINQISQLLGFSSAAAFTRAFVKWSKGTTPKDYRKRLM